MNTKKFIEATRQAADWIEQYPHRYRFEKVFVPFHRLDKACPCGWTLFFYDPELAGERLSIALQEIGYPARYDSYPGDYGDWANSVNAAKVNPYDEWISDIHTAPTLLRRYADMMEKELNE